MKYVPRAATFALLVVGSLGVAALTGCESAQPRQPETFTPPRSTEADALIRRADEAASKGESERAIGLYREAILLDGDRYVAWNNLAVELMKGGDYLDAVTALKVAADLSPRDPRPVTNIGMAYQEMGWARDALTYFDEALTRDETYLDALRGFALAEETLGEASLRSLERIKTALFIEKDQQWREFFERRRFRVEAQLRQPGA